MKFRFKALNKKRQPDQLDSPLLLASPRGWVAVFVVLITAVFAGLWGFLGTIPRTFTAAGVISYPGSVVSVQSSIEGSLSEVSAQLGEMVTAGQELARMSTRGEKPVSITAPVTGRVVSVQDTVGTVVRFGDTIAQVEETPTAGADSMLVAKLLVDPAQAANIRVHQKVTMVVPGVSPRAFGRLRGTVESIGQFPLTPMQQAAVTGVLAPTVDTTRVGPRMVVVNLEPKANTMSGYAWTSALGPPVKLSSRTPVDAKIEVASVSPFSVLVGR